jgi:hypothetical protein
MPFLFFSSPKAVSKKELLLHNNLVQYQQKLHKNSKPRLFRHYGDITGYKGYY